MLLAVLVVACSNVVDDDLDDGVHDPSPGADGAAPDERPDPPTGLGDPPDVPDRRPSGSADPPEREGLEEPPEPHLGAHGVSAGHTAAVETGMRILADGGTAVDAAVAAAFAVSVVEPFASGVGGGGAALVVDIAGRGESYDYREVVAADGRVPDNNTGIPGFVAGMAALHRDHGELPWDEVLAPAIELAADGVETSDIVADQLRSAAHRLPTSELEAFHPAGAPLAAGEPLVQPALAETLRSLAEGGAASFYEGDLAATLSEQVDGIDAGSLADYRVQRSEPPRGPFGDFTVLAAAPPLPGVALIQLLQVAEALDVGAVTPGSADHIHRLMMAWRIADRSVETVLGDPDFVDVPLEELTDPVRNAELAAVISDVALAADDPTADITVAGDRTTSATAGNTTHVTVVDQDGTVVSMTNTLTNFWGSGQHVAGFFLNDQLRRFSIGGESNQPEPGRRSVGWSSPLVVLDAEQRPVLGLGSPGGRRIPTIEANVLVRWTLHGETLADAVEAPRVHLEGDDLEFERLPADDVAADLRARGYASIDVPSPAYYFGSVQALEIDHDEGAVFGAVDPRRAGAWAAE